MGTKYIVQTNAFGYLVKDEDGQKHPQFALRGTELDSDDLGKSQVDRGLELGALAKAADVSDTEDGILRTTVAEGGREIDYSLPEGQSDPATLALAPVLPDQGPQTLTAEQISSMAPRELAGFVTINPDQRESVVALEKKGKKRPAVLALAKINEEAKDVVEGEALAGASSQSRSNAEAVE